MKYLRKLNDFMESLQDWVFWLIMLVMSSAFSFVLMG